MLIVIAMAPDSRKPCDKGVNIVLCRERNGMEYAHLSLDRGQKIQPATNEIDEIPILSATLQRAFNPRWFSRSYCYSWYWDQA